MTIKEYILSQSVSSVITDINIKGMLLKVSTIDDCLIDPDNFDSEDIDKEVAAVLTVKGMDLMLAQMYYILASTMGDKKSVKMGNVSVSEGSTYGVNDRASFKEMGDSIYADWDEMEADADFVGFRSCESI